MTPDQEAKIIREFAKVNANLGLLRHDQQMTTSEMRSGLAAVTSRLDKHGKRIRALEERLQHPADDMDVTGNYRVDVALLQQEQERLAEMERIRRSDSIWAKRQTRIWIGGAIGAVAMAILSGVAAVVFWLLTKGK